MKRIKSLLCVFTALLIFGIPVMPAGAVEPNVFYESFNSGTTADWALKGISGGNTAGIAEESLAYDKSYRLYKDAASAANQYVSATKKWTPMRGNVIVDFKIRAVKASDTGYCSVTLGDSAEKSIVSMEFYYNNSAYPNAALAMKAPGRGIVASGSPVTGERWYHFKIECDTVNHTMNVYLDDFTKPLYSNVAMMSGEAADVGSLTLNSLNLGWHGSLYVDDLKVYQNDAQSSVAVTEASLDLGDLSQVTRDLALPVSGDNGTAVTWTSSAPEVISSSGAVTQQETDREVVLTAKIEKDGAEPAEKQFTAFVPSFVEAEGLTASEPYYTTLEDAVISELPREGKAKVKADFEKPSALTAPLMLACAFYDASGRMVDIFCKTQEFGEGTRRGTIETEVDGRFLVTGGSCKTYVWEAATLVPLAKPLVSDIGNRYSAFSVNTYFSDNMVLQRGKDIHVVGKGPEGKTVTAELNGVAKSAVVRGDKWDICFDPMEADGKTHTLTVTADGFEKTFQNILIGDVYLCSGQSNMAYTMAKLKNTAEYSQEVVDRITADCADAVNYPNIRYYKMQTVGDLYSDIPLDEPKRNWGTASETTVQNFSATAYYFGRELHRSTGVPVGLILSAINGTTIQQWMDAQTIGEANVDMKGKESFYNALIHPFTQFGLAGIVWYQGESNYNDTENYRRYFPALIEGWRRQFGQQDLPFLFVQLPSYSAWDYRLMREVQLETFLSMNQVGMAVLTDVGDPDNLHPGDKDVVGARLAAAARALIYQEPIEGTGPTPDRVAFEGASATVRFGHVGDGLLAGGREPLRGFEVCGPDGVYVAAQAEITGDGSVQVSAAGVSEVIGVRYAFQKLMDGNLYNSEGLPASPFRTDSFAVQ